MKSQSALECQFALEFQFALEYQFARLSLVSAYQQEPDGRRA
jgi:hypothetical protein